MTINILACVPVDTAKYNLPPYSPKSTYMKSTCGRCECDIWVGPRQRQVHEVDNIPIVCVPCIIAVDPDLLKNVRSLGG